MPLVSKRKRDKEPSHGEEIMEGNDDVISQLPDHLIYQILLELPTKDSVKTSVLSTRWRYLWQHVPGLDFGNTDFGYHDLEGFVDRFLGFDKKSLICQFKLCFDDDEFSIDRSSFKKWMNIVVTRGLEHLDINAFIVTDDLPIKLPVCIYTCETLVHLTLEYVHLDFDSVSLPCLVTMHLDSVLVSSDACLERLISSSPVLQVLKIDRIRNVEVLRVRSQTLISLSIRDCLNSWSVYREEYGLVIDAPSLKYLCLRRDEFETIVLNSVGSSTKMDIDVIFQIQGGLNLNEISKRGAFRNFLIGISKVMDLTLSCSTLKAIYDYSSLAPLPQFPNLNCLRASFPSAVSEMLPTFLASCPNLKSLHLDPGCPDMEKITRSSVPECMLTSLEFVEMKIPIEKYSAETELVGYILGNASVLRKLILGLDRCTAEDRCQLLDQLLLFPRRSSACQVVVL